MAQILAACAIWIGLTIAIGVLVSDASRWVRNRRRRRE